MKSTTDIWFAAFLWRGGHEVVRFEKQGRRASFFFDLDGDQWQKLKLEFSKSDDIEIKYWQEKLKDMVY